MSAADVGGLSEQVLDLLDRLDAPGVQLVESWFSALPSDVPVAIDETEMTAAVRPYSWLLHRVGEGIELTSAGYLPPSVVLQAVSELGLDRQWIGAGNREYHTLPVLELRESTRRVGLVRKYRGRLLLTPSGRSLAEDPTGLWAYLADRTPAERSPAETDAGLLLLLAVAAGTPLNSDLIDELLLAGLEALAWRGVGGARLTRYQAFEASRGTWSTLRRIGALPDRYGARPTPPPNAGIAFARAAIRRPPPPMADVR